MRGGRRADRARARGSRRTGDPGRVPWATVLLGGLAVACGADDGSTVDRVVPGAPAAIDPAPNVRLGSVEGGGPQEFHEVAPPSLSPEGAIVVPLRSVGEIRVFDREGTLEQTYGGAGDGPGEFRFLTRAWFRGDTLEAWDVDLSRMTRFLPDGEVETVVLGDRPLEGSGVLSSVVAPTRAGWMMSSVAWSGFDRRDRVVVHHFARDGSLLESPVIEVPGMVRIRAGGWSGPAPLSPSARFAWARGDEGGVLLVGETLDPSLTILRPGAGDRRTIHWEPPVRWDPREAYDRVREVQEQGREEPFRRPQGIPYDPDWLRTADPPDEVPLFADAMVDELGFIWVLPFDPAHHSPALGGRVGDSRAASGGRWAVLTPEGEEAGTVEIPDGLEPYQITEDEVVGIYRDETGVEFVAVHVLRRH